MTYFVLCAFLIRALALPPNQYAEPCLMFDYLQIGK